MLATGMQRRPRGDQQAQLRAHLQQSSDNRSGARQVFEVVQHCQPSPFWQRSRQRLGRRLARAGTNSDRARQAIWNQRSVGERASIDEKDFPCLTANRHQPSDLGCEPGLAAAAGAGQGHQPVPADQPADFG